MSSRGLFRERPQAFYRSRCHLFTKGKRAGGMESDTFIFFATKNRIHYVNMYSATFNISVSLKCIKYQCTNGAFPELY